MVKKQFLELHLKEVVFQLFLEIQLAGLYKYRYIIIIIGRLGQEKIKVESIAVYKLN